VELQDKIICLSSNALEQFTIKTSTAVRSSKLCLNHNMAGRMFYSL